MNGWQYDAEGRPLSLPGVTQVYYDAFNRAMTINRSGTYTNYLFTAAGQRYATMTGGTWQKYFLPLPAGMQAVYTPSGLQYYRHADWLGSSRFASTPSGAVQYSLGYAPFGETYSESGAVDRVYTGQTQDTVAGSTALYDFQFRQHASSQGRWLVPDPAGRAAVDPTNPQTWNRYAYVANNPLSNVDPLGLDGQCDDKGNCTVTATAQAPPVIVVPSTTIVVTGWWDEPFGGWPGPGNLTAFMCMVMGGCSGGGSSSGGGGGGGTSQPQPKTAPSNVANNGRQPNKITCGTVLPNGRTVGSYVNQLSNTINNAPQSTSTPYGPSASYSPGYSPLSIPGQVYSQTNFKINFQTQRNAAFLGDAGNFAYAAVSANIGIPLFAVEAVAGGYALWAGHKDANGPYFMDASATVQIPAGYGAGCKGY
jgi:RHS repeat-associated protein